MIIEDRVYGIFDVQDDVLLELIASKPVLRLKGINQAGASQYVLPKLISRYEHSLGVMLLLRFLKAPLEEQIAGLLHDVPHTAFSHVIDFVFENKDHEFHEKFHEDIIKNSEIPDILKKYNFDLSRILDEKNFPILERKLPDLCADRIDYSLRDRMGMGNNSTENIKNYISSLRVFNNEIIFSDKNIALDFAKDFLEIDYKYWSHPMEIALFQILAEAIKVALREKIISQDDLFADDNFVYNKLKKSGHKEVLGHLEKLNPKFEVTTDSKNYDFYAKNKLRFVDPKFIIDKDKLKRVSQEFPNFKEELQKHADWVNKGHFIKIVTY